uniref:Uncharacterized protein n=1 Tax=Romanomermis culicivorax TaxID=13658 RepID=A0A915IQD4_ROMCU
MNQPDPEVQLPESPQPFDHHLKRGRSMDRPQNCYHECSPSTDRRPQNWVPPPTKFVSFQPQVLKQPPQQPPCTEMLLEQLIQRYERDYEEQKSRQRPNEPPLDTR